MDLDANLLEGNFATLHGVLAGFGVLLCIVVMQLTSWAKLDWHDPPVLQWANRFCWILLALALLWSFSVVNSHGWDPFRPGIAVLITLNLMMLFKAITLVLAIRRHERSDRPKGGRRLEDQPFFDSIRERPAPHRGGGRGSARQWGLH